MIKDIFVNETIIYSKTCIYKYIYYNCLHSSRNMLRSKYIILTVWSICIYAILPIYIT